MKREKRTKCEKCEKCNKKFIRAHGGTIYVGNKSNVSIGLSKNRVLLDIDSIPRKVNICTKCILFKQIQHVLFAFVPFVIAYTLFISGNVGNMMVSVLPSIIGVGLLKTALFSSGKYKASYIARNIYSRHFSVSLTQGDYDKIIRLSKNMSPRVSGMRFKGKLSS